MKPASIAHVALPILVFAALALPSSAGAASFGQIAAWFPQLAAELAADEALPDSIEATDNDGPINAAATTDGSGVYVITPDAPLRAADGELIDPVPDVDVARASLSFDTGGVLEDVRLPKAGNGWLVLSSTVRIRLTQRATAAHTTRDGAVLYRGVRHGVDQLFIANPDADAVKEWLVATGAARTRPFAYELRMPTGYTAVLRRTGNREQIDVRDSRRRVVVQITAPVAIDRAGTIHDVQLRLAPGGRAFEVRVAATKPIVGPLAIDPLYTKTNSAAYPLFENAQPYFWGEVCGEHADKEYDFPGWDGGDSFAANPWMEGPGNEADFPPCDATQNGANGPDPTDPRGETGALVSFAWSDTNGPAAGDDKDLFDTSWGSGGTQGAGVTVSDVELQTGEIPAGAWAAARITAPANVAIWESGFRGHTGYYGALADPQTRCQVELGNTSSGGNLAYGDVNQPWTTGSGNEPKAGEGGSAPLTELFFGGYPHGSDGGGAWARYPYPDPDGAGAIPAGYRWSDEVPFDSGRSVDINRHMWGYFTMNNALASQSAAQILARTPRSVQMRLVVRKAISAKQTRDNEYKCSADGRWRVVFMDPIDPVIQPPALPDGWVTEAEVGAANTQIGHPWRQVVATDLQGSGVDELKGQTYSIDGSGTITETPLELFRDMCVEFKNGVQDARKSLLVGAQPCPMNLNSVPVALDSTNRAPSPLDEPRFAPSAGPHKYRVTVNDFANRTAATPVLPIGTSYTSTPKRPAASQVGWYWVDNEAPSCADPTVFVRGNQVDVSGKAWESIFADGRTTPVRRGSGVARVRIELYRRSTGAFVDAFDQTYWVNQPLKMGADTQYVNYGHTFSLGTQDERDGDFEIRVVAFDGVGKASGVCTEPPPPCQESVLTDLVARRGAGGVLFTWSGPGLRPPGSAGRVYAVIVATITPDGGTPRSATPTTQGTSHAFYAAEPGARVDAWVNGVCDAYPFDGQAVTSSVLAASEFVDRRPIVDAPTPWRITDSLDATPAASKYNPTLQFDPPYEAMRLSVQDFDGFTTQRSGTNYGIHADWQDVPGGTQSDRSRVVMRIRPDRASSRRADTPATAVEADGFLVWEIGTDVTSGATHRYWLGDGPVPADAYTRDFATLPIDATCTAGAANQRIVTVFWTIDCAQSVPARRASMTFTVFGASGSHGAVGDRGARGFDVSLDLRPHDNDRDPLPGVTDRFPTPDREYIIDAAIRDQRQEADSRYLHHGGAAANANEISPATNGGATGTHTPPAYTRVGTLVVDRERPEGILGFQCADVNCATVGGMLHVRDQVRIETTGTHDVDPTVGDPQPARISWTGLGAVFFAARAVTPPTSGFVQSDPIAAATCADPLPYMPANLGTTCFGTYTTGPAGDIAVADGNTTLVNATADVVDVARNFRRDTAVFRIDRQPPVVAPVAIKGASGVAAAWPMPIDISPPLQHEYSCDAGPNATTPPTTGWQPATAAETAGWTSSDVCPGNPGQFVRIWVRITDAVNNVTVISTGRNVDERPTVTFDPDRTPIAQRADHPNPIPVGQHELGLADWHDALDNPTWFGDPRNDDLVLRARDIDDVWGTESINDGRVADVYANRPPVPGDVGRLLLHIVDPRGTAPQDDLNAWLLVSFAPDPANSTAQLYPTQAAAVIAARGIALPGCTTQSADPLQTTLYWEFDCSRFDVELLGAGNDARVTLPIRARLNTTLPAAYPTPDAVFQVRGWVRDQRQPADASHLTNQITVTPALASDDPAVDADADDPNAQEPLGTLTTDRIRPTGRFIGPDFATLTSPGDAWISQLTAEDVAPAATEAVATGIASGLAVAENVRIYADDGDDTTPLPATPAASNPTVCDRLEVLGTTQATCTSTWTNPDLFGLGTSFIQETTVADHVGNAHTFRRPFRIDNCRDYQGQYPHAEFASADNASPSNGNQPKDVRIRRLSDSTEQLVDIHPFDLHMQCPGAPGENRPAPFWVNNYVFTIDGMTITTEDPANGQQNGLLRGEYQVSQRSSGAARLTVTTRTRHTIWITRTIGAGPATQTTTGFIETTIASPRTALNASAPEDDATVTFAIVEGATRREYEFVDRSNAPPDPTWQELYAQCFQCADLP